MTKEKEILTNAQTLFARFGLKKVTTDDIAHQAKISKATIYKYYNNKGEIFNAVVQMEYDHLFDEINSAVESEKTALARFRAHLNTKFSILHNLVNFYNVTQENWNQLWPHISEVRQKFIVKEQEIVSNIIKYGNSRKELNVKDIHLTSYLMVMALKSMEYPWVIEDVKISREKYIDSMLSIIMNGIKRS